MYANFVSHTNLKHKSEIHPILYLETPKINQTFISLNTDSSNKFNQTSSNSDSSSIRASVRSAQPQQQQRKNNSR